ncbi:hypothetical protein [Methanobrevibacter arboriphilus]|uniref:hypothetical protein n=1 Tax=Methanobrevibacter arboriphilus TaxID=39441 RepID=UPI0005B2AE1C|nr:hypothetical protein [Methanobrevibacter arboriphilus]
MAMTKDEKIKLYEELMEDKDFWHEMNKREQARKKGELNIAKNLKSLDMSVDDIAKVTNLSIDEIKKL